MSYEVEDKISKKRFYRLIGGHIEYGEYSKDALEREFKEEVGQDIKIIKKLEVFENLFFYKGEAQHEFVSLFLVEFINKEVYSMKDIVGVEKSVQAFIANWQLISDFRIGKKKIYPPQILKYV